MRRSACFRRAVRNSPPLGAGKFIFPLAKASTAWSQRWIYALLLELAGAFALLTFVGQKALLLFISLVTVSAVVATLCFSLRKRLYRSNVAEEAPQWHYWRAPIIELATFALLTFALSRVVFAGWQRVAPDADVVIAGASPFVLVHCLFTAAFVLVPDLITRLQQAEAARIARRNAERLRVTSLERSLALSELKTLQAQIEPHFLYNVLANVQSMVKLAPDTADAMLKHLIDYLKLALPSMRGGESSVAAELDLVRAYLAIAQLRFGDRLQVRVVCDAPLAPHAMPPMLLLPLVENAVKHGVEPKPGAVQVDIDVRAEHGTLTFRVVDDGAGFTHDGGSGIGIANVRERLAALFNGRANVSVEPRASGGVVSTLTLPMSA